VRSANSWTHFWICSWSSFSASEKSPMAVQLRPQFNKLLLSRIPLGNRISSRKFRHKTDTPDGHGGPGCSSATPVRCGGTPKDRPLLPAGGGRGRRRDGGRRAGG